MLKARLRLTKTELQILAISLVIQPAIAHADLFGTLQQYTKQFQLGLYGLAGSAAVISLVWQGIQWQIARAAGDRSTTFMDYAKEVGVIITVSASVILGTAAWQIFGTSSGAA